MNMEKNIYGAYDACLMKRLGQAYNGSRVYREAARAEDALVKQFREGLTEEQQRQLDDFIMPCAIVPVFVSSLRTDRVCGI